jgi:Mg-chelatase subunit ChlD
VLDQEALDAALGEDPDKTLTTLVEMSRATDETLRAQVRRVVPRLVLDQTRRGLPRSTGVAKRRTTPATRGGDVDLDASMDAVVGARAEGRMPAVEELVATDWARPGLALCLVVDRSGSMNGARLTTAAVAAAACVTLAPRENAVLTFASGVDLLVPMAERRPAVETVATILSLRGHGTTALASALEAARVQLARSTARRKLTLLLSDCRATDDVDAVPAARALSDLVVLAPAGDAEQAEHLASRSGARCETVGSVLEIPRVLNRLLADDRC